MLRAYAPAHEAIKLQLAAITRKIEDAVEAGRPLGRSWLFQQSRAEALEAQIQKAMAGFSPKAESIVRANQMHGVSRGMANSRELVVEAVVPSRAPSVVSRWDVLPRSAVESMVGFSANGSPLRALFDELGPEVSRSIRDELLKGLSLGRNPRRVAAAVNARSGMGLARALTISRTEMLRSYRETTRLSFEQNSDIVQGWIWLSARQPNTCAACWAMDGKVFKTGDAMPSHPNCRCTMVPHVGGPVEDAPASGVVNANNTSGLPQREDLQADRDGWRQGPEPGPDGLYHVYHGTTKERADAILGGGLNVPEGTGPSYLTMTTSPGQAARYAEGYTGDQVVLHYALSPGEAKEWLSAPREHGVYGFDGNAHGLKQGYLPSSLMAKSRAPSLDSHSFGTGEDVFSRLEEKTQKRILGPSKYEAFKDGRITLQDLVAVRRSREWGQTTQVASLRQALGA